MTAGCDRVPHGGADELFGHPPLGTADNWLDVADYSRRSAPLTVTLNDGVRDDGEAGEGDTVDWGVEGVLGGSGDDLIVGTLIEDNIFEVA